MGRTVALVLALACALLVGWLGTKTPDPDGGGKAPTDFSTARAMADIHQIAREPHPVGSIENGRVEDYVAARMTQLGLSPVMRAGMGVESRTFGGDTWIVAGNVRNLVGVLPGRDRKAPALALMAHYDSVPASPGAADDATGVAVALEVVRAIKARGTPARDVIVIITDGEEAGLLGARIFFRDHPLRHRIGLIINMESRGGGGRANMFQTGPGNGALIPVFARTAVQPVSNSLAVFLYENMPNDTDFTVSKDFGLRGLNYAFIGRQFDYHAMTSTPENLDQGSVRHMGDQVTAAALDLAFARTLPGKAPDAVYSQTFGDHVLAYPAWGGWIVLLLAAGLLALAVVRARKAEAIEGWDIGRGAGAALFILIAGALLLSLARKATGVGFGFIEQRPLLAQWTLWETTLAALGAGLLALVPTLLAHGRLRFWLAGGAAAAGALIQLFGGFDPVGLGMGVATAILALLAFRKPAGPAGSWLGVLITGFVAAVGLQIALPAVAFLVAWPLTVACLAAAISELGIRMSAPRTFAVGLLTALGGGWLAVFFHGVAQGLDQPMILGLFLWLGAMLAWPLASQPKATPIALAPAAALLTLGVVLLLVVRFSDPWSERYPQTSSVFHVTDAATGKALLISTSRELDPWSRKVLTAEGGKIDKRTLPPLSRRDIWAAPAATVAATPEAALGAEANLQHGRIVFMMPTVSSPTATTVLIDVKATVPVTLVGVDGARMKVQIPAGGWLRVRTPAEKLNSISLTAAKPGSAEFHWALIDSAWPAGARPLPKRPPDLMPFDRSDSSALVGTERLTW